MKKIIVALFIVMVLILVNSNNNKILIPNDAIRFRIIASSSDLSDQLTKVKIKNELEPIITDILKTSNTIDETRENINNNMAKINNVIKKYDNDYSVLYGKNYFPKKTYKGVTYEEGNYESLVITLGDGLGKNWWCVLFPPLCLLETTDTNTSDYTYTTYVRELLDKYSLSNK